MARKNSRESRTDAPSSSEPQPPAVWQHQLKDVTRLATIFQTPFTTEAHASAAGNETRNWFVISIPENANSPLLDIELLRSGQKNDGQWGVPVRRSITRWDAEALSDASERRALAMLQWDSEDYEGFELDLQTQEASTFNINPTLAFDTVESLCSTERFVWTLEGSYSLDNTNTLSFDGGPTWEFSLLIEPSKGNRKRSKIEGPVSVRPILKRGGGSGKPSSPNGSVTESRPISDVIACCDSGLMLFHEKAALVRGSDTGWVRGWKQIGDIDVPPGEFGQLLETLFTNESLPQLTFDPRLEVAQSIGIPQPRIRLTRPNVQDEAYLKAQIMMAYGEHEFAVADRKGVVWDTDGKQLLFRDEEAEQLKLEDLISLSVSPHITRVGQSVLRIHQKHFNAFVRELTSKGWQVIADGKLFRSAASFHIDVASGQDWFDLNGRVDFDGQSASLPTLLKALRSGEKHVVLDDGTHGILPEQWLEQMQGLAEAGTLEGDSLRYSKNQALLLDVMLAEQAQVEVAKDRGFNTWCKRLQKFSGIKAIEEPQGFTGELREYQREGLGWFSFLREFQFGGCLADDMGLGKTVQVLALLRQRKIRRLKADEIRKPSIVVVPKSLVFNWIEEAEKFSPGLRIIDYTGPERKQKLSEIEQTDLLITTYGTLRRDVTDLKDVDFDYAILDEAHAIKNPRSQAAKSSRLLSADFRLAMSGTPVENHLGDLWSLFDFLNPGMLGQLSISQFTRGDNRETKMNALHAALRPFILRRTKEQVLKELPEKIEQTLYCDMTPAQSKLYAELRDHYRTHLSGKVKELGIKRSKIHVLEALLRLRQAACDPRLVSEKKGVEGAKIELLMEQLKDSTRDGHKTLVFSQFTSLLALVRERLDAQGFTYEYLDGKTSPQQRAANVKRFQNEDDCPLFLISLKAGGHGLNLTAADYVYILDPWWNPAVEAQAIDRSHRLGQTKSVMAYRIICRDTVEDKIVRLQENKRKLADAIIAADGGLISQLSADDLQMLFA